MDDPQQDKLQIYKHGLRVRACGICLLEDRILLVGHQLSDEEKIFWAPPGGGVMFSEKASETVQREFLEETGLQIAAGDLLFVHEYIGNSLHALELFFQVHYLDGSLRLGYDPEFIEEDQNLKAIAWMSLPEIRELPADSVHQLFSKIDQLADILTLSGMLQ
jgi:8-oxo-dGTP diphosphatase